MIITNANHLVGSVKQLHTTVHNVGVQLATIGGHLEAVQTRLESGSRRFEMCEASLKELEQQLRDNVAELQKEVTRLASNQRIFMYCLTAVGTLCGIALSVWLQRLLGMLVDG